MAVTVTNTAPPAALNSMANSTVRWLSSYGTVGVTAEASDLFANKRLRVGTITLSGTYATNGFALVPSAYGLREIHGILLICDGVAANGAAAVPILTTAGASPIVKLVTDNAGTELTNTTSVTNYGFCVLFVGI